MPLLPGVEEAGVLHLEFLVPNIELARAQQSDIDRQMVGLLEKFKGDRRDGSAVSDVELIRSMPGAGAYVTAVLLTQASEGARGAGPRSVAISRRCRARHAPERHEGPHHAGR